MDMLGEPEREMAPWKRPWEGGKEGGRRGGRGEKEGGIQKKGRGRGLTTEAGEESKAKMLVPPLE